MSEQQSSAPPLTRGQKAAATRAANKLARARHRAEMREKETQPEQSNFEDEWEACAPKAGDTELISMLKSLNRRLLLRKAPPNWQPPSPRRELRRQPVVDLAAYRKALA